MSRNGGGSAVANAAVTKGQMMSTSVPSRMFNPGSRLRPVCGSRAIGSSCMIAANDTPSLGVANTLENSQSEANSAFTPAEGSMKRIAKLEARLSNDALLMGRGVSVRSFLVVK